MIGDTARSHLTMVLPTGISIQATTVEKTVTFALALPAKYMVIMIIQTIIQETLTKSDATNI